MYYVIGLSHCLTIQGGDGCANLFKVDIYLLRWVILLYVIFLICGHSLIGIYSIRWSPGILQANKLSLTCLLTRAGTSYDCLPGIVFVVWVLRFSRCPNRQVRYDLFQNRSKICSTFSVWGKINKTQYNSKYGEVWEKETRGKLADPLSNLFKCSL